MNSLTFLPLKEVSSRKTSWISNLKCIRFLIRKCLNQVRTQGHQVVYIQVPVKTFLKQGCIQLLCGEYEVSYTLTRPFVATFVLPLRCVVSLSLWLIFVLFCCSVYRVSYIPLQVLTIRDDDNKAIMMFRGLTSVIAVLFALSTAVGKFSLVTGSPPFHQFSNSVHV